MLRTGSRLRRVTGAAVLAAAVLLGWWILPPALGGSTTSTIVVGNSMLPHYRSGDLVVARDGPAAVGDVVVYRAPGGQRIIHRITGGDGVSGWVVQGDDNDFVDPWQPTDDEVLGIAQLRLPRAGAAIHGLGHPLIWPSLFVLAAAVVVWPRRPGPPAGDRGGPATDAGAPP